DCTEVSEPWGVWQKTQIWSVLVVVFAPGPAAVRLCLVLAMPAHDAPHSSAIDTRAIAFLALSIMVTPFNPPGFADDGCARCRQLAPDLESQVSTAHSVPLPPMSFGESGSPSPNHCRESVFTFVSQDFRVPRANRRR